MAENRLIGDYPVIGIRPTIDGRRGPLKARESLEEQTMNMAKSAAELFRQNLKYSNGEPVKVVIADTTIGRVAETAACADKFRKEGVDITLTVTPCWCYGSETMDMDKHTIKGVWGFNGTERPGAVYLAAVLAAPCTKRIAGIWYLWKRCSGSRCDRDSGRRKSQITAFWTCSGGSSYNAWEILPSGWFRYNGNCRIDH